MRRRGAQVKVGDALYKANTKLVISKAQFGVVSCDQNELPPKPVSM